MKKIFLSLIVTIMFAIGAGAEEYTDYCAKEPYDVGNSFTQFISNVTGLNFIKTKIFEATIQKALKKELNSDFNIEIYPFGAKSLSEGKFQKVTAKSKHIYSDKICITDFKTESLCPYNKANVKGNNFYFNENFVANFEGTITDGDMKKMLETQINKAGKVNIKIGGLSLFKISNPNVSIKNKRIYIEMDVQTSNLIVSKTTKVSVNTALTIKDGEIEFSDTKIGENHTLNTQIISPLMNMINPFNRKIKLDDYNTAELKVNKLIFGDNEIKVSGIVYIPAYSKN